MSVPEILRQGAAIYEQRNKEYGDNYRKFGKLMEALFPDGVSDHLIKSDEFGIFIMIAVKMSRIAERLDHQDTADDMMVYSAMLSQLIREKAVAKPDL